MPEYRVKVKTTKVFVEEYLIEADDLEEAKELAEEEYSLDEDIDFPTSWETQEVVAVEEIK
jgi:hypothetical protein